MKKLYILFVFLCTGMLAKATIYPIQVQASSFSPSAQSANCGDTIVWIWAGSGSHTTTSTTIPGCATSWDAPIGPTSFTFAITIPANCPGTYNYKCTPHGFTGVLNVTCANGVNNLDNEYVSIAYPNPVATKVTIEFPAADMITLYNALGEKIKTIAVANGQTHAEISVADIGQGVYFYSIIKEGAIVETRKFSKN